MSNASNAVNETLRVAAGCRTGVDDAPGCPGRRRHPGAFQAMMTLMLSVWLLFPSAASAEPEELKDCDPEPTNMLMGYGDVVACQIDKASDQDLYSFQGSAGSIVVLSLVDTEANCGGYYGYPCPYAEILAPGDVYDVLEELGPGTESKSVLLPTSGMYRIRVRESGGNQTTGYRLGLERLSPVSPTAVELSLETVLADETIDPYPDQDFFTFAAARDCAVTLSVVDRTSNCGGYYGYPCPEARLFAPDDTELAALGPGTDSVDLVLPEDGVYTIHVRESGNNQNETYNLGVQVLFPPPGKANCDIVTQPPTAKCNGLTATIVGTAGDDVLKGTANRDIIAGLGGDDVIYGFAGNDVICGGNGNDTLIGNNGNDVLVGQAGNDLMLGDYGNDRLVGNTGRDTLIGGPGADALFGGPDDDVLIGGEQPDVRNGRSGFDVCDNTDDTAAALECELTRNP